MTIPVWLLIALPLAGAAVLLLSGQRSNPWGHLLGCATSLGVVRRRRGVVRRHARPPRRGAGSRTRSCSPGCPVGGLHVDFGLQLDQLSMCFVLLITGVGSLIHIYSIGYMADDPEPPQVLRVPEPVPGRHAAAGARRQLPRPLRRLGRRRPGVLPADRVLAAQAVGGHRGQEGVRGQPGRRHRPRGRADGDVRLHRLDLVRRCLRRRAAARAKAR